MRKFAHKSFGCANVLAMTRIRLLSIALAALIIGVLGLPAASAQPIPIDAPQPPAAVQIESTDLSNADLGLPSEWKQGWDGEAFHVKPARPVAAGDQEVCLSTASTPNNHPITLWNTRNPDITSTVYIGQCKWFYDGNWGLRVHIPWSDRYWIGQEGEGYGPCHNGPRYDSDPPSIWPNGQYVKYKTNDNNDPC